MQGKIIQKWGFILIMLMAVICVSGAPSDYGNEENIVYNPYYNNSYHIVSIINDKTVNLFTLTPRLRAVSSPHKIAL